MLISEAEQAKITKRFPKFELSYETPIHKKVYSNSDIFMAIPYGQKYYAWFTYYHEKMACLFIELYNNKKIKNIFIRHACFDEKLCEGTILYGTIIENRFFYTENIIYYCGQTLLNKSFHYKYNILVNIFSSQILQKSFLKNDIIFTSPLINSDYNSILDITNSLPYKTYGFKFINPLSKPTNNMDNDRVFVHKKYKQEHFATFKVMADVKNDIYKLFGYNVNSRTIEYHNIAYISSYNLSVKMNKMFRNIKENENLDALEESDDEEEFQNVSETKFVDMKKSIIMKCVFNIKFKKWEPVDIITDTKRLTPNSDIYDIENKFKRGNRKPQYERRHDNRQKFNHRRKY